MISSAPGVEQTSHVMAQPLKALVLAGAVLCLLPFARSQPAKLTFDHFSTDQGLSAGSVRCIYQDSVGYLWFGTFDGADRYDGYSFTSYKHDPEDTASIANAFVNAFCEDRTGDFWVGTQRGLERFDRRSGTFTHYLPYPMGPDAQWRNPVFSIQEGKDGILWIGTVNGLSRFDRSNGTFTAFRDESPDARPIDYTSLCPVHEDRAGSLWMAEDRSAIEAGKEAMAREKEKHREA